MQRISIVVPTYNRANTLRITLDSLITQNYPEDMYEIIVADNNSTDDTRSVVESSNANKRGVKVRYLLEPRQGVHYARNSAAKVALNELLYYTDDDVSFDPGWVAAYAEAFAEHPEMAAAAGPVRPIWEQPPPQWLLDYMGNSKSFGILSLMEPYDTFQLNTRGYFFSCNMAIWKTVLKARGGFHPEATGDVWLGDGESGLNKEMWAEGDLIGYVPDALVYHHIPPSRMTVGYFCRRMANEGACTEYARFHEGIPGSVGLALRITRIGLLLVRQALMTPARLIIRRDRFAMLRLRMGLAYNLSRIRYVLRLSHDRQLRELVTRKNWLET